MLKKLGWFAIFVISLLVISGCNNPPVSTADGQKDALDSKVIAIPTNILLAGFNTEIEEAIEEIKLEYGAVVTKIDLKEFNFPGASRSEFTEPYAYPNLEADLRDYWMDSYRVELSQEKWSLWVGDVRQDLEGLIQEYCNDEENKVSYLLCSDDFTAITFYVSDMTYGEKDFGVENEIKDCALKYQFLTKDLDRGIVFSVKDSESMNRIMHQYAMEPSSLYNPHSPSQEENVFSIVIAIEDPISIDVGRFFFGVFPRVSSFSTEDEMIYELSLMGILLERSDSNSYTMTMSRDTKSELLEQMENEIVEDLSAYCTSETTRASEYTLNDEFTEVRITVEGGGLPEDAYEPTIRSNILSKMRNYQLLSGSNKEVVTHLIDPKDQSVFGTERLNP